MGVAAGVTPVFIVGTGRCGSTFLTRVLNRHPALLGLSEFFTALRPNPFPVSDCDGMTFWAVLNEPWIRHQVALQHDIYEKDSPWYPVVAPGGRFDRRTFVPPVLTQTYPFLTQQCDELYDETRHFVQRLPHQGIATHYASLFSWLLVRFGKARWIERSGDSLRFVPALRRLFPDAKFIHIVRNGPDAAYSMSRRPGFRMAVVGQQMQAILGFDPFDHDLPVPSHTLTPSLAALVPNRFSPERLADHFTPLSYYGELWSQQISVGLPALHGGSAESVLTVTYEDLLQSPIAVLKVITDFIDTGLWDAGWAAGASGSVSKPTIDWRDAIGPADRQDLLASCRPGLLALDGTGVRYPNTALKE